MAASSLANAAARWASSDFLVSSTGTAPAASSSLTSTSGAGGVRTRPPAAIGAGAAVVVVAAGVAVEPRSSSDMSSTPKVSARWWILVLQVAGDRGEQFAEGAAGGGDPDRRHRPAGAVAGDLGHDLCVVRTGSGELVASDLGVVGRLVDQPAEGVLDLREVLAGEGVDGEHQRLHLGWNLGQVDPDGLVVALPRAGAVVARVLDRAVLALELPEPDLVYDLAGGVEQQGRGVEVDVLRLLLAEEALLLRGVPAQPHADLAQGAAGLLLQRDGLTLAETHPAHARPRCARRGTAQALRPRFAR